MTINRDAFFIDASVGKRFCLVTRPQCEPKGALLYIPPFAEELNKSRRMAALAAQAFAREGWLVLQLDLLGCGDSTGDFSDAGWGHWLDDITLGWRWLQDNVPAPSLLWSLRAGCLLASDWLLRQSVTPAWLMWQPVINGRQHLNQFLRLKTANAMLADTQTQTSQGLREMIVAGQPVEIAGYTLGPALFEGLDAATLVLPERYQGKVAICEVSAPERQTFSPAVALQLKKWEEKQFTVSGEQVSGPAFWQTLEIEEAPQLIECSVNALEHLIHA